MIYEIQQRIETLSRNAIAILDQKQPASFASLDVRLSHWEFNLGGAWKQDYWLASSSIEGPNINEVYKQFSAKLAKIVPRIALISQCYVEHLSQPYLIHRTDTDVAFVRYITDIKGVGLMFREEHLKGLNILLENAEIPDEFYYYWNDAVNSVGYSPKLLLMFSAIEALVKIPAGKDKGKKDWEKLELILGTELKAELFGVKGNSSGGLRHRLVHGEYFNRDDSGKDYLALVHKKIISHFNNSLFAEKLINEGVVRPQRHFWGNKEEGSFYIRSKGTRQLTLKEFLSEVKTTGLDNIKSFEFVYDDALTAGY